MKENFRILEITDKPEYEIHLYKCISPIPFRKYKYRSKYLNHAIPKGLKKKILIYNGKRKNYRSNRIRTSKCIRIPNSWRENNSNELHLGTKKS
ncbi:MAG: hypothetical protein NDF54_01980 [archaeon GB-1867-035]|nr:hypothetical protein [Candidatus Culexmicrobium profundum]